MGDLNCDDDDFGIDNPALDEILRLIQPANERRRGLESALAVAHTYRIMWQFVGFVFLAFWICYVTTVVIYSPRDYSWVSSLVSF
jgi:hypothetical protein